MRIFQRTGLFLAVGWLACTSEVRAQEDSGFPADQFFVDPGELFARQPEDAERIRAALAKFRESTGFSMRFAVFQHLRGRTVTEKAQELQKTWMREEPGVMMAFTRDTSSLSMLVSDSPTMFVPRSDLRDAQNRAMAASRRLPSEPERLARMIELFCAEATEIYQSFTPQSPWNSSAWLRSLAFMGVVVAVVAGLLFWGVTRARKRDESRFFHYLPRITTQPRLGANFGGGTGITLQRDDAAGQS